MGGVVAVSLRPESPMRVRGFAGPVESVGRNVTRFRPGDEVYTRREVLDHVLIWNEIHA
ncbi:hypothetical protein [Streptomyces sp. 8N616]|uniref:hypothetical protein n=1 Tax=Streptomyces sp. 8N616 TaxID=3457414 RepID=UPI003FD526E5